MRIFCLIFLVSGFLLGSGCSQKTDDPAQVDNAGQNQNAAAQKQGAAKEPEERVVGRAAIVNMNNQKKGIIGKQTQIVVDLDTAMEENPKLERVDPKFKAKKTRSPLGLIGDLANKKRAQVSRFGMIQMVNIFKVENDRLPTHEEFMEIMRETGSGFAKLPEYQTYAYNAKTGEITVLIDNEKKKKMVEAQY